MNYYTTIAHWLVPGTPVLVLIGILAAIYFKNNKSLAVLKPVGESILHFQWTKGLLYWLILSSGTMSECAFLLASLWMSLNANIHKFILLFTDEGTTTHISEVATAAYVALPECILGLAFVITIGHIRTFFYNGKRDWAALTWSVLYGLPTLVFLVLSLFTLGNSVLSINFQLPPFMVVIRAEAGYMFAFVALLYSQLGKPQEADRLREKDDTIAELKEQCQLMAGQIDVLRNETASHKRLLAEQKNANSLLVNELQKTDDDALQAYGDVCLTWLKSGVKSASVEDISHYTGHSKRKISGANLARSPRNPELILISALVSWLKMTPPSTHKAEDKTTDNILYIQPQEAVNVS